MTDKKSKASRRKLLKSIAAGSGAVIAGKSLPERWAKPVVDSVMLPAHALTSIITTHSGQTMQIVKLDSDSMFAEVLESLVPEANAQAAPPTTVTYYHCITPNTDRTAADIVIVVNWVESDGCTHNARYHLDNVPVVVPTEPLQMMTADWYSCQNSNNGFVRLTSLTGNAVGRYECGCGGLASDFDLPIVECNLPSAPVCTGSCPTVNCLAHDTLILTPGNNYRAIDSLQIGDLVTAIAQDGTSIYTIVTKVVTEHMRDDFYTINGDLRITDDHPILVSRESSLIWCRIDNLVVGDQIRSLDGYIEIASLEYSDLPLETVYVETQCGNFIAMAGAEHYVVKSSYADAAERLQRGEVKAFV